MLINTVKELFICVLSVKAGVRVLIRDAEVSRVRAEGAVPGEDRGDLLTVIYGIFVSLNEPADKVRQVDPDRRVAHLLITVKACASAVKGKRQRPARIRKHEQVRDVSPAGRDQGAPGVSGEALCAHCLLILRGGAVHSGAEAVEGNPRVRARAVNLKAPVRAVMRGALRSGVVCVVRHFCKLCKGCENLPPGKENPAQIKFFMIML